MKRRITILLYFTHDFLNNFSLFFVKVFTHTLLTDIHQNRERLQRKTSHKKEKTPPGPDPSALANARQVACKILNLSQSDLEDILSARDY